MMALKQRISAIRRALGKKEMAALLLFAVAVIFYAGGLRPAELRLELIDQRLSEINRRITQSNAGQHDSALDPAAKLERFYQFFSREETATDWLARLYDRTAHGRIPVRRNRRFKINAVPNQPAGDGQL
jgi:hypothetical protein